MFFEPVYTKFNDVVAVIKTFPNQRHEPSESTQLHHIRYIARAFVPLFQPTFVFNLTYENNLTDSVLR